MALISRGMCVFRLQTRQTFRVIDLVGAGFVKGIEPTHVVWINTESHRAIPELVSKTEFIDGLLNRELVPKAPFDPGFEWKRLSDAEQSVLERRWAVAQALVGYGLELLNANTRADIIRALVVKGLGSRPFIYGVLRMGWQRGTEKRCYASDLYRCGAPGRPRVPEEGGAKAGRPRHIQLGVGVPSTSKHRANMQVAWAASPVAENGRGLDESYAWMVFHRYGEFVDFNPEVGGGELPDVKAVTHDKVPSFAQFKYQWGQRNRFRVVPLNRKQSRSFEKKLNLFQSGTLIEPRGIGTRYYIDATVIDVYCVSRADPSRIVGRPTLYVVVDGFSRMIVGFHIGLEPPCWEAAMLAVYNCTVDKVALCALFNISIRPEYWPTGHIPLHLMGDRAELMAHVAEGLVQGFGLDVENAPPYSGAAKGVVERKFGTLQARFGPYLPGYVDKDAQRRGEDSPALSACLDLHAVTNIILYSILDANLSVVRDYDGWPEVTATGTPFVPVELWNWCLKTHRCDYREYEDAHLRRYLWPRARMKCTVKALKVARGLFYMGANLLEQPWFAKSQIAGAELDALMNPNNVGEAFLIGHGRKGDLVPVELTRAAKKFKGLTLGEVAALGKHAAMNNAAAEWNYVGPRASYQIGADKVAAEAKAKSRRLSDPTLSKASRLRGVKANKQQEIDLMNRDAIDGALAEHLGRQVIDVDAREVMSDDEGISEVKALIQAQRLAQSK